MASSDGNTPGGDNDHTPRATSSTDVLEQIHANTHQLTQMLAAYFAEHGAIGFFEAQAKMLSGLRGLIETVRHHDATTDSGLEGAVSTDQTIR